MAQFTNQAQLSYSGKLVNSNVAVGDLQGVLSATKTAVSNSYTGGGQVTYVVSVTNSGSTPITNLTVTDNLGGYTVGTNTVYPLAYVDGSAKLFFNGVLQTSAITVTAGPPLVVSGITLPANTNMQVIYETNVTSYAPLGKETTDYITNDVSVTGDGITTPATASEMVMPANDPTLTITKNVEPVPVVENGTLTYTFTIQNIGNTEADATDLVSIIDTFNPILSNITVKLNGTELAENTGYTYSGGVFTTVPGVITVPAATFTQDETTGEWDTAPGFAVLEVSGTV